MKRTFHLNRYCTVELVHTLCSNKLPKQGDCTTDGNYRTLIRIRYDLPAEMRFTFDHEMSHLVEQHLELGAKSETVANRMGIDPSQLMGGDTMAPNGGQSPGVPGLPGNLQPQVPPLGPGNMAPPSDGGMS